MHRWWVAALLFLLAPGAPASGLPTTLGDAMPLPDALLTRARDAQLERHPEGKPRVDALMRLLFATDGIGLVYDEDATHDIATAVETRRVNCLSFTLLFVSLARALGIEATAQLAEQTLSWHQRDQTLIRNNHVNALVRSGVANLLIDLRRESVILRRPARPISDQQLLAHYYNNLAMIAMERGDLALARERMQHALQLAPEFAPHWSNSGVLHRRAGAADLAERDQLQALALDRDNTMALFNLVGLAQRRHDVQAEQTYQRRLEQIQRRDPFHHFLLAGSLEREGRLDDAITHYRRAIRLHPGEPRFHAALAAAYLASGQPDLGRRALGRAWTNSRGALRDRYREHLDDLACERDCVAH